MNRRSVDRRSQGARWVLAVATALGVWALFVGAGGGFRAHLAGFAFSSRNAVRPAIAAAALVLLAWALDRNRVRDDFRILSRAVSRHAAPLTAATVLIVSVLWGARAASGADESGYVSQSVLWFHGKLRIEQPVAATLPWPDAAATMAPLGYRASGDALVPTYAPGLPILMSAARFVSPCALFFVVPFCAAMLVLFTWLLGRRLFGGAVGTAASIMVATSPVVLMLMLAPITDVPVAAFWIAALFFSDLATVRSAAVAGALAGMAAVVRPNLAPLVLFPLILTMVHGGPRRSVVTRAAVFCLAVAPFALFIALLHQFLYGSPLTSGYGDIATIFSLRNFSPNARAYALWWWQTHGPIGWLLVIGLLRPRSAETRWRVLTAVAFAIAVGFSYAFYLSFTHWGFLRFVLSAVPVALWLAADAVLWLSSRFGGALAAIVLAAVTITSAVRSFDLVRRENVFGSAAAEQRYADAGLYVATITPRKSVIVAMQHTGSVRYYSGRMVLRYDLLDPAWLDRALDALETRGFSIYALLEEWEEVNFRNRFATQQSTRMLDAGPRAIARSAGRTVRFFILRGDDSRNGGSPVTMPATSAPHCPPPSPDFQAPITN